MLYMRMYTQTWWQMDSSAHLILALTQEVRDSLQGGGVWVSECWWVSTNCAPDL